MDPEKWPDHQEVVIRFKDGSTDHYDPVDTVYIEKGILCIVQSFATQTVSMDNVKNWIKRKYWEPNDKGILPEAVV